MKAEFGDLIAKDVGALKNIPEGKEDENVSEQDLKKLADDEGCSRSCGIHLTLPMQTGPLRPAIPRGSRQYRRTHLLGRAVICR